MNGIIERLTGKRKRDETAKLVLEAYLVMLQIPHESPLRTAAQSTMAKCRDFVAETVGLESEYVQDACEAETQAQHMPEGMRHWSYDPPPYSLSRVEVWRHGWAQPQVMDRLGGSAAMNVYGLYWREQRL